MSIAAYLQELIKQKKLFAQYLRDKNIDADDSEKYNTLIAKVQQIETLTPKGCIDITSLEEVNVREYEFAKILDENLKPENIAEGVEVLGITGTFKKDTDIQINNYIKTIMEGSY